MIKEHRESIVNETKEKLDDTGSFSNHRRSHDLLYALIEAQEPDEGRAAEDATALLASQMTDLQLRDEVMTIFLAGHETTANALTWTFYLLSQYPEVERRLYDELCTVLGKKEDGAEREEDEIARNSVAVELRLPTIKDVPRLEYAEKVFRESMRLFPPAWTLGRQAMEDYTIDKYVIPHGSIVLMSQYVMHHNPRYFANPDTFDPDRWTREFQSTLPRFSYFPFGGGIRGCVGEPFAWMEGILVLATICRNWQMYHDTSH